MEPSAVTYPLSLHHWRTEGAVEIFDRNAHRVCTIPYGALRASGDANWSFVIYCIRSCVEDDGDLTYKADGTIVEFTTPVHPGKYTYRRRDNAMLPCTPRRGPVGKRRGRPAGSGGADSVSTMSNSRRSTTKQNKLRTALLARDGRCLITDKAYHRCTASHIVPYSRPDIYELILGYQDEWLFHCWMGLLLENDMSHTFDRYEISIYPKEHDEWVVHVFYDQDGELIQYHGKTFSSQRFQLPSSYWPMKDLLLWHHQQCIQMHYRGYSHRMSASDDYNPVI